MTQIGFLLFPHLTQLDLTGPWEVLSRGPGAQTHLIWKTEGPVPADSGMSILPTRTFENAPKLDVLVVPGGKRGVSEMLQDKEALSWLSRVGADCQYITSVCTGSLILGAAGLLEGYAATTHWSAVERLAQYGASYRKGRVVRDRNRFTGGGVTAGIDFGLTLAAELWGPEVAMAIQLGLEYNPDPPFNAGSPDTAPAEVLSAVKALLGQKAS